MSGQPPAQPPAQQPTAPHTRRLAQDPGRRHHGAASFIEQRFAKYVDLKKDGGPLEASYAYNRTIFGGRFPAQTVQEISGATYQGRTQRSHLPATMPFAVSFYAMALKGRFDPAVGFLSDADQKDGMGEAMDLARSIYELWYEALLTDLAARPGLRGLVQDAQVTTIETGTTDSVGNPLMDETNRRLLVVYRPTVLVTF